MTQKFLGLAEIAIIGTDTFKYKERIAHRYHFTSWRAVNPAEGNEIVTDRFYVWADSPDQAYKYAVEHVYREHNAPISECIDRGEGGSLFDADLDEQHKELVLDSYEDWCQTVG